MEIVRTDALFGSKKNIVGSTSADLVLETLGKVYIKTGKSTKTLTEILSEYSKNGTNLNNGELNIEELSKLLSDEYMENLIILILTKKKIFGEFVTVDSVKSTGNYNLPVYFDSKAEAKTILGLSVQNKIETEDIVCGLKGVAAAGICDLTIFGGYNESGGGITQEVLDTFWVEKTTWIDNEIVNRGELYFKSLLGSPASFTGNSLKTITSLVLNENGNILTCTFTDIPDAGTGQKGLVNLTNLNFYGLKIFNGGILLINDINLKSKSTQNAEINLLKVNSSDNVILGDSNYSLKIYGQDINFYVKPSSTEILALKLDGSGLTIGQGISCYGICDLTLDSADARILALEDRIYALEHPNLL